MNFYRRYIGDFQADTMGISMMEQGAYDRLLDHYYATEKPIPLNSDRAAIICRAITLEERAAVAHVLSAYFVREEAGWRNHRADKEIQLAKKRSEVGKNNGKAGAESRWDGNEDGKHDGKTGGADGKDHGKPDGKSHGEMMAIPVTIKPLTTTPSASTPETTKINPMAEASPPPSVYSAEFLDAWEQYPKREGDNPKREAARAWNARVREGVVPAVMLAGLNRYRKAMEAKRSVGTAYVMQAKRFFGPDQPFLNEWKPAPSLEERNLEAVKDWVPS